ncbi:hypothetical protein LIT32_22675 [Bacillus sp. CMF21]|nr:hypothetical protein LIT32_22675 [Bacillus sp. CMF21]
MKQQPLSVGLIRVGAASDGLSKSISEFVSDLEGYMAVLKGNEILFFSSTTGIDEFADCYIRRLSKKKKGSFSLGIGIGATAYQAAAHARIALSEAAILGEKSCLVNEGKQVMSPFEKQFPLTYDLSITSEVLMKEAKQAGVSAAAYNRLRSQISRAGKYTFTANDLSAIMGISTRSVHRKLVRWLDEGLIGLAGVEKLSLKGRPRQLFHLTFLEKEGD